MRKAWILLAAFLLGCAVLRAQSPEDSILSNIPDAEIMQDPAFMNLPDDAGFFFGYQFSHELNDAQVALLLSAIIDIARDKKIDLSTRVVIFGYESPEKSASMTADYVAHEVEYWETPNGEDYVKRTFSGDVDSILGYLRTGVAGNPKVESGKITDEVVKSRGKRVTL